MTWRKKTILEMAREAGLHLATNVNWMPIIGLEYAEKLIALVRADEREACEKLCDDIWQEDGTAYDCREAIRARSNT